MYRQETDFCFCALALGEKYRILAKELARDLEKNAPGRTFIIGTDRPSDFKEYNNVSAYKQYQQGILHCYHDKRFPIAKSLETFSTAILVDADTKFLGKIPNAIDLVTGINGCHEELIPHVKKYTPERLSRLEKIATKLNINLENTQFIGESLLIVSRDEGKEKEFIKEWGEIGRYLELRGIYSGEGNIIGIAAARVGWDVARSPGWETINRVRKHIDASYQATQKTAWQLLKRKLGYHYRLNKTRVIALKNFNFYYR